MTLFTLASGEIYAGGYRNLKRAFAFYLACYLFLSACSTILLAQTETLDSLIKANSYPLSLSGGRLEGDGMDFLMRASADAQFFTIGEEHNVQGIPQLTALLFTALHDRYHYNYLALEQDPLICRMVSARPLAGHLNAIVALAHRYPNGFTFNSDQELQMISQVGALPGSKADRIWGLDQVFGALHVLERLLKFAPSHEARHRTLKLIEDARKYDSVRFTPGRHYMGEAPKPDDFFKLTEIYKPRSGSEAEFLIAQLLLSARVYQNYQNGTQGKVPGSFENGREREENMKDLFMLNYRRAQAAGDKLPKALLKFGHWHLYRGLYKANVPTLGNFVSEFAKSNGMKSFQLATYLNNKAGGFRALPDDSWLKPLAEATPKDQWVIIDLRPLRDYTRVKGFEINPELKELILGFDAALMMGGESPGTFRLTTQQ
jgi:hypothetical protein